MTITISLPYEGAAQSTETWARSQAQIDFLREKEKGCRCTVAFAASELKRCIRLLLPGVQVIYAQEPAAENCIMLRAADPASDSCVYSLLPAPNGLKIEGESRTGVLYGAYEFLKLQGFRWYFPDKNGEFVPPAREELIWPQTPERYAPDMDAGRGFELEGLTPEDEQVWLWMARNRLNVVRRNATAERLQRKLGMCFKEGGHIFEPLLHPNHVLADGRTVWESHREWYGTPAQGVITPENALSTQFCVSNEELVAYLTNTLIQRLQGEWSYADRVDIWGFDTWGNTCQCERCRALGNSSDQFLYFVSRLRDALNQAALDQQVELVICSYEGTATLLPPEHDIPRNLLDAGDLLVFFPITRCYRHTIDQSPCWENERFHKSLTGWLNNKNALRTIIGEYYNVSKFEDLPLLFERIMSHDLPEYVRMGVRGITYMHFPVADMSLRALNHVLYAELSWNAQADVKALVSDYFAHVYDSHAPQARQAYQLIEESWVDCAQLRSWSGKSILSQLLNWNGQKPNAPLSLCDGHFRDVAHLIERCQDGIVHMQQAADLLAAIRRSRLNATRQSGQKAAMNPAELGKMLKADPIELRVAADLRSVHYGIDVLQMMCACITCHNQRYQGEACEETLNQISELFDRLEMYTVGFSPNRNSLEGIDALTRSQLRGTALGCLQSME